MSSAWRSLLRATGATRGRSPRALAAGCTVVQKPSDCPLSAIFTEILHKAGVPKGVFNVVNGDRPTAGEAISGHSDIDMVSFTGSTRVGILVAKGPPRIQRNTRGTLAFGHWEEKRST
jgi:acyl-CoA reductase-like NAD-dependent aldehyde dehydrogenase